MPDASNPIPPQLYFRLSAETLHFARYSQVPAYFGTAHWKIRPEMPLGANLREAVAENPLLQAPVSRTRVLVEAPVCIVPLADFQEEDCETIYNYCFAGTPAGQVFYDTIPGTGSALLFALSRQARNDIEECFPHAVYQSAATPLLRRFAHKAEGQQRIFASVEAERMFLAAFDESRLLSACLYTIHAPADAVYYIAYTARTFGLDLHDIPVFVSGTKAGRDSIGRELERYARHTVAVTPAAEFNRHPATADGNLPYDLITLLTD